jgi:DNA polymerase-1
MRILAHYCQEPALIESFQKGEDIHTRTAMEIVGDPTLYTPEMRQVAKAINYGLIYGMSAFRLAKDLSIPQAQAEEYITQYFQRYPQVVAYLQQSIVDAQQHGMSHTILGRQRPIAFLDHPDTIKREAAERIALNAPIQGTAADIMKLAMIAIDKKLSHEFPSAKLLLQIHDELVIESDTSDAPAIAKILKEELEHAYALSVPLEVTVSIGDSWGDIH